MAAQQKMTVIEPSHKAEAGVKSVEQWFDDYQLEDHFDEMFDDQCQPRNVCQALYDRLCQIPNED